MNHNDLLDPLYDGKEEEIKNSEELWKNTLKECILLKEYLGEKYSENFTIKTYLKGYDEAQLYCKYDTNNCLTRHWEICAYFISYHNGDPYAEKTFRLNDQEINEYLLKELNNLKLRVKEKIKEKILDEEIEKRLKLIIDSKS